MMAATDDADDKKAAATDDADNKKEAATDKKAATDVFSLKHWIEKSWESIFRVVLWNAKTDEELGQGMRFIHLCFFILFLVLSMLIPLVFPESDILILLFVSLYFWMWCQHIICNTCPVSNLEKRLLKEENPPLMMSTLLEFFGIPGNDFGLANNIFVLLSTFFMCIIFFLFLARILWRVRSCSHHALSLFTWLVSLLPLPSHVRLT
jgi:hypothetical protein